MKNLHLLNDDNYTQKDAKGVVKYCSVVRVADKAIIFHGSIDEVDEFLFFNTDWDFKNKVPLYEGEEVTISNIG